MTEKRLDTKVYGKLFKIKDDTEITADSFLVLRAADNAVPAALTAYRTECEHIGADPDHLAAVDELIKRVDDWRAANPDKLKIPDTEPRELAQ